jgi:hypothetical protein
MDTSRDNEYNLTNLDFSKLHPYSLGIVAKDIEVGSDIIEVYPMEKIPDAHPEIGKDEEKEKDPEEKKVEDTCGNKEKIKIKRTQTIKARWLSINQYNRITPPTIRKGEYVILYRLANADIFFWDTLWNDPKIRKEEVAVFAFSDKKNISKTMDINEYYHMIVNTFSGFVSIVLPPNNGEPVGYTVDINAGAATLAITDTIGNRIVLKSKGQEGDSKMQTEGEDLSILDIFINDQVIIKTDKKKKDKIVLETRNVYVEAAENVKINAAKKIDLKAGAEINLKAPKINLN